MSEPEDFLARWSRRKHQAAQDAGASKPEAATGAPPEGAGASDARKEPSTESDAAVEPGSEPAAPAFDPASLPSLESITAETDIRAFLAPGVPAELTRAALRRGWSADPNIRDFIGLSESSWDFNAPGSMGGFGPLEITDELRRQIAQMVGRGLAGEASDRPLPTSPDASKDQAPPATPTEPVAATAEVPTQPPQDNVGTSEDKAAKSDVELDNCDRVFPSDKDHGATQHAADSQDNVELTVKRSHGRALPK